MFSLKKALIQNARQKNMKFMCLRHRAKAWLRVHDSNLRFSPLALAAAASASSPPE